MKFVKLEKKQVLKIVDKVTKETNEMLKEKKVTVKLTAKAKQWVLDKGYDPNMGARLCKGYLIQQLKKTIQRNIIW